VWWGKGVGVLAFGTSRRSIHRSAWKRNSRKLVCSIPHTPVPQGRRTANRSGPAPAAEPYILWWCIKIRCSEWYVADEYLAVAANCYLPTSCTASGVLRRLLPDGANSFY
jgi:hypothetical protein